MKVPWLTAILSKDFVGRVSEGSRLKVGAVVWGCELIAHDASRDSESCDIDLRNTSPDFLGIYLY